MQPSETRKRIGFVFIEPFADWEFGFLSGSATEYFGSRTVALTPGARTVESIGGLTLTGQRGFAPEDNQDLDAVAIIGSDSWAESPPDMAPLLTSVADRGGVVGGICAGTLALARAGLFDGRAHTSNGRDWILHHLPDYAGASNYRDVPHAVADGRIVSAPGSAPGTFAVEFLAAVFPEKAAETREMRSMFAREHQAKTS